MKKFMIASLGLSLLSGTAMFAQDKDTAGSTESSTMKKNSPFALHLSFLSPLSLLKGTKLAYHADQERPGQPLRLDRLGQGHP
jgi:hypothetical protein